MTKELAGKIAFVTGSGRGLGRAMAERLAELGADVAIHDISWTAPAKFGEAPDLGAVAKAIARHGGKTAAVIGNIGDKAAVARMKEDIEAIAPAATSAHRAASRSRTTRSAFRSRISGR
jgi:2-hydroxycyclohexanecarboxyl-CoA dehydrogenase